MYNEIIIDGYNLIYRMPRAGEDMAGRRHALLRQLEESAGTLTETVTLVFDGAMANAIEHAKSFVNVKYSPPDMTADAVIEQMVCASAHPGGILVVTSDRVELDMASAAGAHVMSCAMFLQTLDDQRKSASQHIHRLNTRSRQPTLGDFWT